MYLSQFNYFLPKELIAQSPNHPRDSSRLLVLDRKTGLIQHKKFYQLVDLLAGNDVLVLNDTKVFPARLIGRKESGGKIEIFLIKPNQNGSWQALTKPGVVAGNSLYFNRSLEGRVILTNDNQGISEIKFRAKKAQLAAMINKIGHTPIPPYIHNNINETNLKRWYQTVYAKHSGSVAAPTAGFHFTKALLEKLRRRGVQIESVTLHVSLGTFMPVKETEIENHKMQTESFYVSQATADRLKQAKTKGKRIISVGTTTTRVLETITANKNLLFKKYHSSTNIYIYPPYHFKFIDGVITNFHLPGSTLLMLVSAFTSYPNTKQKFTSFYDSVIGKAYQEAINKKYRFYSFGDAMLIS